MNYTKIILFVVMVLAVGACSRRSMDGPTSGPNAAAIPPVKEVRRDRGEHDKHDHNPEKASGAVVSDGEGKFKSGKDHVIPG